MIGSNKMHDSDPPQRVPIKEHFEAILTEKDKRYEQRFDAQEKAVNAALTAAKEAVVKAETAAEKRFDAVNEFRSTLSDQATTFMPRKEAEAEIRSVIEKSDRAAQNNAGKIEELQRRMDRNEGRSTGFGQGWAILCAGVGLLGVIAAIIMGVMGILNSKVERNAARLEAQQQSIPVPVSAPAPLPVKQTP